jgi:ubiquinone/menaquinone biosynthesis C-methylase UbiE
MIDLSQRGRSGLQFLGSLQTYSSSRVRAKAKADFERNPEGAEIISGRAKLTRNNSWKDKIARARKVAEKSIAYKHERFYQRYVAEENFVRAIPAIEERRSQAEAIVNKEFQECGGSLKLNKKVKIPEYYEGVEWHLEPGGWDSYDLAGPMFMAGIVPHVFSKGGYAAVEVGDDIKNQRVEVTKQLPKESYERIYEMGCGGTTTLLACHKNYPNAELFGSDLSAALLKGGHNAARAFGVPIHLKQKDSRYTEEPDNSVDAVIMYALLHEMPVSVGKDCIKEAYRILKPGGDILLNDPPPFSAVHPFQAVILDWDTENRGEPFFSETCATEWDNVLRNIGFVNVKAFGLGDKGYPWINLGSKPL